MARYEYDDFWVEFSPRAGAGYDVAARAPGGETATSAFELPFTDDQLEQAVRTLGSTRAATTRDIGEVTAERKLTAEQLGGTLADALLAGQTGALYTAARSAAVARGRGVRLWLSLGDAPGLLSVPWEFLYLQPTFLASQRKTPIVRFLRTDAPVAPRRIEKDVRILGVVASPDDLAKLDVAAERQRVDTAVRKAQKGRKITIDWLESATPKALRLALQGGDYHILHFVGHSGYVEDSESADGGGGVIFLENEDRSKAPVSDSQLVNLLGDQDSLRLVVLNSCEGARTSVRDPFAGIATSIVALGIPAVVAMQFEISDDAAIAFAEELYASLIAREEPIDVAVAEARKAVFTEINETEWATPVLFLRNQDGRLFDFVPLGVAALIAAWIASLKRVRPVWLAAAIIPVAIIALLLGGSALAGLLGGAPASPSPGASAALVASPSTSTVTPTPGVSVAAPSATVVATPSAAPTVTAIPTVRGTGEWAGPRGKSSLLAVAGAESSTISHLGTVVPKAGASGLPAGVATSLPNVYDTDPTWTQTGGVLGFTRVTGEVSEIQYVVPGVGQQPDGQVDKGITVKDPIDGHPPTGVREHAPAWRRDGNLIFARTSQCAPGRGCSEDILEARLTWTGDWIRGNDAPAVISQDWSDIRHISVDPLDDRRYVVTGRNEGTGSARLGFWLIDGDSAPVLLEGSDDPAYAILTPDGRIVALMAGSGPGWGRIIIVTPSVGSAPEFFDMSTVLAGFAGQANVPDAAEAELGWISASPKGDGSFAVLIADRPRDPDRKPLPTVVGLLDRNLRLTEIITPAAPTNQTWNDLVALGW